MTNGLDGTVSRIDSRGERTARGRTRRERPDGAAASEEGSGSPTPSTAPSPASTPRAGRVTRAIPGLLGATAIAVGFGPRLGRVAAGRRSVLGIDPGPAGSWDEIGVGVDPAAGRGRIRRGVGRRTAQTARCRRSRAAHRRRGRHGPVDRCPTDIVAGPRRLGRQRRAGRCRGVDAATGHRREPGAAREPSSEPWWAYPNDAYVTVGSAAPSTMVATLRVVSDPAPASLDPALAYTGPGLGNAGP